MELQKIHNADRYETNFCLNTILELPLVAPQQKIGRWIDGENTKWKCSGCGYGVLDWNTTPYCPNCGAKMQEVEE